MKKSKIFFRKVARYEHMWLCYKEGYFFLAKFQLYLQIRKYIINYVTHKYIFNFRIM